MLFVAAAVLFTKLMLKPSSPSKNPFESDARKPRKEYVIDQKERDAVIKQNYNVDKVSEAREVFPTLSFVIGVLSYTSYSIQGDHSDRTKPPVDFKTKVLLWPGLVWPVQTKAELLF